VQFTLQEKVLPAYYRSCYYGSYRPVIVSSNYILHPSIIHALHYHSFVEIGICQRGHGVTHVDNRIYRFAEGDMQFVPAGVPHLSAADPEVETRWQWISLDTREILARGGFTTPDDLLQLCADGFAGVFHPWEYPRLAETIRQLQGAVSRQDEYSNAELAFLLGQMLLECARIGQKAKMESVNMGYSGKLKPAIMYIRENFADREAMREERIAQKCSLSASHFRAVFKRETGQSVQSFLLQTRLARAAHLLKTTNTRVAEIAAEAGFSEVTYFNRIFFKTFHQTPTAFRKQYRFKE